MLPLLAFVVSLLAAHSANAKATWSLALGADSIPVLRCAPAFRETLATVAQDPPAVEVALGLDRPTRRLIQQGLRSEGFDPGAPDGLFGPRTRTAIRAWQASREHAETPYLDEIDRTITASTSGRLAGMIIEPIQGYGGIVSMPEGYIAGAFERVRARGGLCVIDEVQSGYARTGDNFWAFEAHGVVPDIVVTAKGIGNGYPLAAVIAKRDVAEALAEKFYFNTYGGNPVSCAAGRAVLKIIARERLQDNARTVGAEMLRVLKDLQHKHQIIGDVRGHGLMMAIELVKDRGTKAPATEETAAIFEASRDQGLVLSKSGPHRSVLRMVPPLCLEIGDVGRFADAIEVCFRQSG